MQTAFKMLASSSFLITAYLIVSHMLNKNEHAILWLIMLALFAYVLYFLFGLSKSLTRILKVKGNFCWIPLFIFCVAFSCTAPI
jgi:archaellum biogenesis protein FlaJ (TadC family)